jgi:predicted transposase/invertase (TIGR01784 family)
MDDKRIIRFDYAMKRMLRDKANFAILEGLIQVLTGRKLRIVEILESEGNQYDKDDKYNRVDIMAKDQSDDIIIVEVQLTRQRHYYERILYGTSKAIVDHISLGEGYEKVKKVYSINILYMNFGEGNDYLYHGTTKFIGVHTHDQLNLSDKENGAIVTKTAADIFPEYYIIRVNEFNDMATTPLEEWMDYLKNARIRPDTTTPGLQEAREKLNILRMNHQERLAYERVLIGQMNENESFETARHDGFEEGLEEGRRKAIKEMTQRLIDAGIDPKVIAKATGTTPIPTA